MRDWYFTPDLFTPSFRIPPGAGAESYPRSVGVMSLGPDLTRSIYCHREHGFLVDPGGYWLQSDMGRVIQDPSDLAWFRSNYSSVRKLTVDQHVESSGRLIDEIKGRIRAHVLVFNMVAVDPHEAVHSYRLLQPEAARRREFNIALTDPSTAHDFDIIDVDHIAKVRGVSEQVDFAHFSESQFGPIAAQIHRVLQERETL